MRKKRNIVKVSVVLLVLISIIVLAILGITTLFKAINGNKPDINQDKSEESAVPSGLPTDNQNTNYPEPPLLPAEDKTVLVTFKNDILTLNNIGDLFSYSYDTGDNKFIIKLNDRTTDKSGTFSITDSNYFNEYTISEEEDSILIIFDSDSQFNFEEKSTEDTLEIKIVSPLNNKIIKYRNDLDRHYMLIDEAALSNRSDSEIKFYEETYDSVNLVKKITISKKYMPDLLDEKVILNDGYLKYYEIVNKGENIEMIFSLEEELTLYPNTRDYNSTLSFIKNREEEKIIVLDPGHGGIDGGTTSEGEKILEKNVVLSISSKVADKLRAMGYNVYNLREEDVFLGLKERTDIANHLKASSFVSIHVNAYDQSSVNGTMTIYKTSLDLAGRVQNSLVKMIGSTDIGLVKMMDRSTLNGAEMESIIVEIGFLTNPLEAEKLNSDEYQELAAEGIADGISEFYENSEVNDGN